MSEKIPTIKEKQKIENYEIEELYGPIQDILKDVLPSIEKGEYDLIIGIDASGRIPTLILEKFIKHVYSKNGLSMPDTRFVAGRINEGESLRKIKEWNPQNKVLIIEDTIAFGQSIEDLCQALRENDIPFDIVAVANLNSNDSLGYLGADNIYFGSIRTPAIYNKHRLGGVEKEGEGEAHSRPLESLDDDLNSFVRDQGNVNEARSDVSVVVNGLIDWYESQKQDEK